MEEGSLSSLYIVLKDHANETLLFHFVKSQSRVLQREALKEGVQLESPRLKVGDTQTPSCLATLVLTKAMDQKVATQLLDATKILKSMIDLLVVDKSTNGNSIVFFFLYCPLHCVYFRFSVVCVKR